ncbi:hypothetical protein EVA_13148 [gut metagenome]|uniref:Uncharacterized protein n=1 Tax=gut metagenome TaxID=749906 RepID=J9CFG0_9ZZZZ
MLTVGTFFLIAEMRTAPLNAFDEVIVSLLSEFETLTVESLLTKL